MNLNSNLDVYECESYTVKASFFFWLFWNEGGRTSLGVVYECASYNVRPCYYIYIFLSEWGFPQLPDARCAVAHLQLHCPALQPAHLQLHGPALQPAHRSAPPPAQPTGTDIFICITLYQKYVLYIAIKCFKLLTIKVRLWYFFLPSPLSFSFFLFFHISHPLPQDHDIYPFNLSLGGYGTRKI